MSVNSNISKALNLHDSVDIHAMRDMAGAAAVKTTGDRIIDLMDEIERDPRSRFVPGQHDCDIAPHGAMYAKSLTRGGDRLITFRQDGHGDHTRRFLVTTDAETGMPAYWMDNGGRAVPVRANCKYLVEINAILKGGAN